MNKNTYNRLASIAVFTVPIAPAVFLGLQLFSQGRAEASEMFNEGAALTTVLLLLALAAGMTAVGLEFVGIISGHVTAKLYQRKDRRWVLTAAALVAYTYLGYTALSGTAGAFAFLIAPIIYFVTAVSTAADEQYQEEAARAGKREALEQQKEEEREDFSRKQQLEQLEFDRQLALRREEHEHQLRLREADAKSRERIARAEARAAASVAPAPALAQSRNIARTFPALSAQATAHQPGSRSKPAQEPVSLTCSCGYKGDSMNALKGHQRWCAIHKAEKGDMDAIRQAVTPAVSGNGNGHG